MAANGKPLPTEPMEWGEYLRTYRTPSERRRINERVAVEMASINLADLRHACNLTQQQLAQRLATSQPNVARLEAAKGATFASVIKVAAALGLEVKITRNGRKLWASS